MNKSRATYLFRKYFNHSATEEEKDALLEWINNEKNSDEILSLLHNTWNEFNEGGKILTESKSQEILGRILSEGKSKRRSVKFPKSKNQKKWLTAAAVALIVLTTGGYMLHSFEEKPINPKPAVAKAAKDILPGGNKAVLTLANGNKIILDNAQNGALAQIGNTKVLKLSSGQLAYKRQNSKSSSETIVSYNSLIVPRGGQYQITLPDNSKVWLNSGSILKFPTAFTSNNRKVVLVGEAYFEIAENKNKPFYVTIPFTQQKKDSISIKVLGTHFNVNAYTDEPSIKTTLLEGAVKIEKGSDSRILKPGQQAKIIRTEDENIEIVKPDIDEVIAWKNGLFQFDDEDISSIMRKISRWYNIKVIYKDAKPKGHYTGIISRNTNLSQVLKVLELGGVMFKIQDDHILVIH